MTDSKHSPGPWKMQPVREFDEYGKVTVNGPSRGSRRCHIAEVWNGSTGKPEVAEANARLIAAAPDLLAALQTIVRCPWTTGPDVEDLAAYVITDAQMDAARAAIKKATQS